MLRWQGGCECFALSISWRCEFERFDLLHGLAIIEQCVDVWFQQVQVGFRVVIVEVLRGILGLHWQVVMHCISASNSR